MAQIVIRHSTLQMPGSRRRYEGQSVSFDCEQGKKGPSTDNGMNYLLVFREIN
jgi:cold shock CspA family protein